MVRIKSLKLSAALLVLSLSQTASADPTIKFTYNGNKIKWHKSVVSICVDSDAQNVPDINNATQYAANVWNETKIPLYLNHNNDVCDIKVTYKALSGWSSPYPIAITTITHDSYTGESLKAEIIFNTYYQDKLGDAQKDKNKYDVPGIMVHELGHCLGLNEDYTPNKAMSLYTELGSLNKRKLYKSDIAAIYKVYSQGE